MAKRALLVCALAAALITLTALITARAFADGGHPALELPAPEAISRDEALLRRAQPPEQNRPGLNQYNWPTFEEVLAQKMTEVDPELVQLAGRLLWGEAGCVSDDNNRKAALWCAINRVEQWGGTLKQRILQPYQFHGMAVQSPVPEHFYAEATEILALWEMSQEGWVVPRLPVRFTFFEAGSDGLHNVFSTEYGGGEYWDGQEGFNVQTN